MLVEGTVKCVRALVAFLGGFVLGQLYYNIMLKDLPYDVGYIAAIILSVTIGLLNVVAIQVRCISLLTIPMYLGKDGRRVLKGLILTYVVAGPIMNMSLNAREVVRVFACSEELAHNLSLKRYGLIARPLRQTLQEMEKEIAQAAEVLRYFQDVTAPIESEMELASELQQSSKLMRSADAVLRGNRSDHIERKYKILPHDEPTEVYQKEYLKKSEYRCNNVISGAVLRCEEQMLKAWQTCSDMVPWHIAAVFCEPLITRPAGDVPSALGDGICDYRKQIASGLAVGYAALKTAKSVFKRGQPEITIIYKDPDGNEVFTDVKPPRKIGDRVKKAFEEKFKIIETAITVVNICQAVLFLRIAIAAQSYHDKFLTNIDFDNIYVTDLFRKIEKRRLTRNLYTLLPLKKMERSRYVDVYATSYTAADRHRLLTQTLKVLLEVVTATTFVMLDRLFYEALDVVSQHAKVEGESGTRDLEIEVEGTGFVAKAIRSMVLHLRASKVRGTAKNTCLPHPRIMPAIFYLRIYGGYLWVLLLLCLHPYTSRLRRLICSFFYPRREKQRVLHLYNDILKKRIKLDATLRRKAVQLCQDSIAD